MKCAIRSQKIDKQALVAYEKHDKRLAGNLSHVDKNRTKSIRTIDGNGDIVRSVDKYVSDNKATIRKNVKNPYIAGICIASPKFFTAKTDCDKKITGFDFDKVNSWQKENVRYLRRRFGNGLIWVGLDLDEAKLQIDFIACNTNKYIIKTGKVKLEVSPGKAFLIKTQKGKR